MSNVKFGTSGWRATTADDFNAMNLQRMAHALSNHVKEHPAFGFDGEDYRRHCKERGLALKKPVVVVGYDTRFMSEYFARLVADVMASNVISIVMSDKPVPVPVVAWTVAQKGAVGGITITASEGAAGLNGIKWTPFWGGPATSEVTDDIEKQFASVTALISKGGLHDFSYQSPLVNPVDLRDSYFDHIGKLIDFKEIKKSKLKIGLDPLFGATSGYLRPLLEKHGIYSEAIHENRDVLFGGRAPYTGPDSLSELSALVRKSKLGLGLACDCDGDRFGIIDSEGEWVSPNEILGLVLDHLVKNRGMKGRVCKNVVTSYLVNMVAKMHGLEVRETPVGFKFIGEMMRTGNYILGGEESGGLSILGHVPEKDGILASLLVAEMVAMEGKPLSKLRAEMRKRFGEFHSVKVSVPIGDNNFTEVTERLLVKPPLDLADFSVWRIDQTDGFKFILRDGSWLGLRPSGTERLVRLYAESTSKKKLDTIVEVGKDIIKGKF